MSRGPTFGGNEAANCFFVAFLGACAMLMGMALLVHAFT